MFVVEFFARYLVAKAVNLLRIVEPVFVCRNNTPEAVVLSFEEFQNMQEIVEAARREQFGQQMVCDLLDIAQLTDQPIKPMLLNKKRCV